MATLPVIYRPAGSTMAAPLGTVSLQRRFVLARGECFQEGFRAYAGVASSELAARSDTAECS
jgi:hypothetical protein